MANYDTGTLTIPSMNVAQHDILRLTVPDSGPMNPNSMDSFAHDLGFDGGDILNDVNHNLPSIPFTPSYELSDAFSATFEDPFSYSSVPFETVPDDTNAVQPGESTSTETHPDNNSLSFGNPILKAPVMDDNGHTWPAISAELYGMFFVAEDVFEGETPGRPKELTCYRRNLFQISGTVALSRSIAHILNEEGQQVPIYDLKATLSAFESIDGKKVEIISVPYKINTVASSEDRAGTSPPKWSLDLRMNPDLDPTCVSIPIAWKRLQFKHATANNGRRKGLQQHYVVQINMIATLATTGESVKIAEIQSRPIIVRGRSPRNFDTRKDVAVNEKKPDTKPRTSSDVGQQPKLDPSESSSANSYRFYALDQLKQPLDLLDWTQSNLPLTSPAIESPIRSAKKQISSPNPPRPPIPKTRWKPERSSSKVHSPIIASVPVDLSLADDEYGKSSSGLGRRAGRGSSSESPDVLERRKATMGSPVEDLELLYEYFPLSLDDWMPPVDAIYRPHVVHHTIVPPELKEMQVKNKAKRYFVVDD